MNIRSRIERNVMGEQLLSSVLFVLLCCAVCYAVSHIWDVAFGSAC